MLHHEPIDVDLVACLADSVGPGNGLMFYCWVPLRGHYVDIAILLEVETFAARADLEK